MRRFVSFLIAAALSPLMAQDLKLTIVGGEQSAIAIPDLRGVGEAQPLMQTFNRTLWSDVEASGLYRMVPKTTYPRVVPQQPSDWRQLAPTDWSAAPVSAKYLAFGYTAVQNGMLVLYGWLWDVGRGEQVIGKRYVASSADEAGIRRIAREFAADIVGLMGGKPLLDTHSYFTSDRTGSKEIWAMDFDGSNQRQITKFKSIAQFPAISPDGSKVALTAWPAFASPRVFVYSTDPVRDLGFHNRNVATSESPSFTPDGRQIVYASTVDRALQIFAAGLDGASPRQITFSNSDDAEPKVNPKTGREIVFSSGRSGPEQIYLTDMEGGDSQRLTDGTGEASNPSWSPNGQMIAFAWTQGIEPGHFNVFVMDVASRKYLQLTHGEGTNENPTWAPDGTHIAFGSNRGGTYQIWTMLATGEQVQPLTSAGNNTNPVWGQ